MTRRIRCRWCKALHAKSYAARHAKTCKQAEAAAICIRAFWRSMGSAPERA